MITEIVFQSLNDKIGDLQVFVNVNKSHEKTQTNNTFICFSVHLSCPACLLLWALKPLVPAEFFKNG